jgi:phosphatidate cytidylyltransferase
MTLLHDRSLVLLFGGILGFLALATVIGQVLRRTAKSESGRATVVNMNDRIGAWWVMVTVFAVAILTGPIGSVLLFGLLSLLALREFITLTATRRGDHRTLVWSFFLFLPLQYILVYDNWYGFFSILIPVYAFLYVPTRSALAGDTTDFLGRVAEIQWALMVAVYCVSHAPALLMLDIPGYRGNAKLLLYLVLVVQMSDVLQYVWGKLLGKHKIAPSVSPNKTVEGFVGGVLSATLLGTALYSVTPFRPLAAAGMSLAITLMGFAGGLTMSAIKRDRGVKDFGATIAGHGGILDRIDSVCFAAPIFFHLTRYFYTP